MENTSRRKKKNKVLPLCILVAILCVLAVAYSTLSAANQKKAAQEAAEANQDTTIMLAQQNAEEITELAYCTGDGGWITMTQTDGTWTLTKDAKFPLNQTIAAGMASAVASIGAMRRVEEGNAADYGLDEPTCEIHVTYAPGTTYRYAIGDRNSFNSAYYFQDDDGSFYMIAAGLLSYFQRDIEDLIVLDSSLESQALEDITGFVVTAGTLEKEYLQTTDEVEAEDGSVQTQYNQDVTDLYALFCELDLFSWADYYADSTEMAEAYGIDGNNSLTLQYKKTVNISSDTSSGQTTKADAKYVIYFGDTQDGQTYYSPKGSTIVYTAADDIVRAILQYAEE